MDSTEIAESGLAASFREYDGSEIDIPIPFGLLTDQETPSEPGLSASVTYDWLYDRVMGPVWNDAIRVLTTRGHSELRSLRGSLSDRVTAFLDEAAKWEEAANHLKVRKSVLTAEAERFGADESVLSSLQKIEMGAWRRGRFGSWYWKQETWRGHVGYQLFFAPMGEAETTGESSQRAIQIRDSLQSGMRGNAYVLGETWGSAIVDLEPWILTAKDGAYVAKLRAGLAEFRGAVCDRVMYEYEMYGEVRRWTTGGQRSRFERLASDSLVRRICFALLKARDQAVEIQSPWGLYTAAAGILEDDDEEFPEGFMGDRSEEWTAGQIQSVLSRADVNLHPQMERGGRPLKSVSRSNADKLLQNAASVVAAAVGRSPSET